MSPLFQHSSMSELIGWALGAIVVLLVLILVALIWIGTRLKRTEPRSSSVDTNAKELKSSREVSLDGAFGKFLSEHPELVPLKKSEQFAAFRKWRKDQGLNWKG